MSTEGFDWFRVLALMPAALTYALAIANLAVSFAVLRPTPFTMKTFLGTGAGFLWTHIVLVVLGFQGFVTWGIIEVVVRFHTSPTWRPWLLAVLCTTLCFGYVIIFRIELSRLRLRRVITNDA